MGIIINILAWVGGIYLFCLIISIIRQAIRIKRYRKRSRSFESIENILNNAVKRWNNCQINRNSLIKSRLKFNGLLNDTTDLRDREIELDKILDDWEENHPNWRDKEE